MPFLVDAGLPILFSPIALLAAAAIAPLEAGVLCWLRWKSFRRSVVDSFIINFASIVGGFLALFLSYNFVPGLYFHVLEAATSEALLLATAFAFTVPIEGFLLVACRGENTRSKAWLVAVAANLASFGLIALAFWKLIIGLLATVACSVLLLLLCKAVAENAAEPKQSAAVHIVNGERQIQREP